MVPEVSEGYNAAVLGGIEDHLMHEGYFYFVASHRFRQDLIDEYPQLFLYRSVDGLIVVNRGQCPMALRVKDSSRDHLQPPQRETGDQHRHRSPSRR
jgi:DNA-binding LacI/PurR family transcriptional regulator